MVKLNENNFEEFLKNYVPEKNENSDACRKCKGVCCNTMGCEIFPQDVMKWFNTDIITVEMIYSMLKSGYVQIDWWEGDVRESDDFEFSEEYLMNAEYVHECYYLHMRNVNEAAISPSYTGCCRMLTKTGCALSWDMRPTAGCSVVPDPDGDFHKCTYEVSKPHAALAWMKYSSILESVVRSFPQQPSYMYTLNMTKDEYPVKIKNTDIHTEDDMRYALTGIESK